MISLVVPIYNMSSYLEKCMKSIFNQDYQEYEVILIDDGSVDRSGVICDTFMNCFPNVTIVHKKNGGLSSARNVGMDISKGDFVTFPDPDDWLERDYLSTFSIFQQQYDADVVCTGYYIDYDERSLHDSANNTSVLLSGFEAQKALLLPPKIKGFAWNKIFRCSIIRERKLRFLNDVGPTEDLDFAFRLFHYCRKVYVNQSKLTYHYYQRDGAATHSKFSIRQVEAIHTYEKIIEAKVDDNLSEAARVEICNTAMNLTVSYIKSGYSDREIYKNLRKFVKENIDIYLFNNTYGMGRKIQAVCCRIIPHIYVMLK